MSKIAANRLVTLRELALAVQAFDRSLKECAIAFEGRPFTDHEVVAMLKIVRSCDPREITAEHVSALQFEIRR